MNEHTDYEIGCEDLQYISRQIEGLRDAVCRPAAPTSIQHLEYSHDGMVGDLTEAVCAVATALFSISHAIEKVADAIEDHTNASDA